MPAIALALYGVFGLLTFGVRIALQVRRTGSTGFRGVTGRPGSVEWFAGLGFALAVARRAAAPGLALLDVVEPIEAFDTTSAHVAGIVLAVAGILATFAAQ